MGWDGMGWDGMGRMGWGLGHLLRTKAQTLEHKFRAALGCCVQTRCWVLSGFRAVVMAGVTPGGCSVTPALTTWGSVSVVPDDRD